MKTSALRWYTWHDRRPFATQKGEGARRQRHPRQIGDVPGRDEQPARVRVPADLLDDALDLIDGAVAAGAASVALAARRVATRVRPAAPLRAVDGPELTVLVRPRVPDVDPVPLQVAHVRAARQVPEQLADELLEREPFRRQQR
jgi:hypothetical protein